MFCRKLLSYTRFAPKHILQVRYKANKSATMQTMNDLPVPQGCWDEWFAKRNAKHNKILFPAIGALMGTIGFIYSSDPYNINISVPIIESV